MAFIFTYRPKKRENFPKLNFLKTDKQLISYNYIL